MKTFYKNLIIFSLLAFAMNASALGLESPDLALTVNPAQPLAGADFTVSAKSFSFDIVRANFQWSINGKLADSGIGLTEKTFTASKLGSAMTIKATATTPDGSSYSASATINIADIDFVVNALTYAPDFYRGAALASPGSTVEIYALPHIFSQGVGITPQNIIYEWSLGDTKMFSQSGQGKNKLSLLLSDVSGGSYDVSLSASSVNGAASFKKSITVRTYPPEILFYETNKLTGEKRLAFSDFEIAPGASISIRVEPYFFDPASLARAAFTWLAGDTNINDLVPNPRLLEVSAPSARGSATIFSFKMGDKRKIFQNAEASLTVSATQ